MTLLKNYTTPKTLAQQIAENISSRIIAGEFPHNYQLKVLDLAGDYSASQTVIRDALNILDKGFIVENIARKGAFVRAISSDEIYAVWEIKKRLWSYAFRLFCENHHGNIEIIAEFNRIMDGIIESGKKHLPDELFNYNFELANFLIANCESDQLAMILSSLEVQVKHYRHASILLDDNMDETARLMSAIQEAVQSNQPLLAEQYGAEFIEMDRRTLLNSFVHKTISNCISNTSQECEANKYEEKP
jgi:DNA-binding GntR family transcriptional regulator